MVLSALCLSVATADPRLKPTDYPAHGESPHVAIGAEYLVNSFSNGTQTYFLPGYLVVDTAVYPHGALLINHGSFKLRMNGKIILPVQAPNMVAYSLQNPDFVNATRATAAASAGNGGTVIIGESPTPSRFPGDRRTTQPPPQIGSGGDAGGQPAAADVVAIKTALPEGEFHSPQGGFLYFAYEGKTKKIKSLDLLYNDGQDELVVKLF